MSIRLKTESNQQQLTSTSNVGLCASCCIRSTCAGVRHCARRSSGEKLPAYEPVR